MAEEKLTAIEKNSEYCAVNRWSCLFVISEMESRWKRTRVNEYSLN